MSFKDPGEMDVHTLLFTDIVDSTKVVQRLGDTAAACLWADHDRLARELLAQHGGLEIDRSDGFSCSSTTWPARRVSQRATTRLQRASSWLRGSANHERLPEQLQELAAQREALVPGAASEQVRRVGMLFALVAAAGELASEAGITGWPAGQAAWAVRQCFNAWLAARGHLDNGEEAAMLGQVRAWLETNGDSRLTWMHRGLDDHKAATLMRAGFKRLVGEDGKPLKVDAATEYVDARSAFDSSERARASAVDYLIFPEAFRRDVCKGYDAAAVAKVLKRRGHLVHEDERLTIRHRLPGASGKAPCYHIRPSILEDELGVL